MHDLIISRIRHDDVAPPLLSLVQRVQEEPRYAYEPHELAPAWNWFTSLVERASLTYVATRAGRPIGYCVALPIDSFGKLGGYEQVLHVDYSTTMYIAELGVAPTMRRQGIASIMVQRMHNEFPAATTASVVRTQSDNNPAITLYQQLGYHFAPGIRQELNGRIQVFLVRRHG